MITQNIHVRMDAYGIPPVIHAVEGDTWRYLDIYTDDAAISTSNTAAVAIHRPDNSYYTISATPDVSGFYHLEMDQALTRPGKVECQLKVSSGDLVISTYTFYVIVEPSTTGLPTEQLGYDIYDLIDAAQQIQNVGLTEEIKQALLDCFEHVAWTDEHGQDYVDALEAALYPPANLVSISAVYTQSGTVYDTDTLDSLRDDLVVTAHYDDSSSSVVANYTLSGTLSVGTSAVTVSYGGKTTTFSVTVTEYPSYSITYNLTNVTSSNTATKVAQGGSYTTTLSYDDTQYVMPLPTITMGGVDVTSNYYDSDTRTVTINEVTGNLVITAATATISEITFNSYGVPTTATRHVYSDGGTNSIGQPSPYGYDACRMAPVRFATDTVIRVTFTNETTGTLNKGNIFLGSFDPFYESTTTELALYYGVITTANLDAGASITREFTVKAGHYPSIWHNVSGTSKYTITAVAFGEPVEDTVLNNWVCNTRPGSITHYASSDGSGDSETLGNYPYISYSPMPTATKTIIVKWLHNKEYCPIVADIASGEFSGQPNQTASAITAYGWGNLNTVHSVTIANLPFYTHVPVTQGMQKLFRGNNANNAFTYIQEVSA